ncbi:MAG TPA: HAD family hydrolase [Anaerolineae bacterium]|nr:HAD family hydrolase [Anaerolineae bacterium]HQK15362.1 HAD family hydrolase [Anaerolineae bacterium]
MPIPFDKIQGWLFDLDGTLMDTDDQAVESLARRLKFLGPARANQLARRIIMAGETPMNYALTAVDMVGLDAVFFGFQHMVSGHHKPTFRIIEGVKPMLAHLAERARLAVVSTRSEAEALEFLRQHELTDLFTLIVTQTTTKRLKPHPEPVLYAVNHLGLPPDACAMVGDTPVDILSGRRAGVWTVGVLCGFGEEAELRRAGAHLILSSTADLLTLVK